MLTFFYFDSFYCRNTKTATNSLSTRKTMRRGGGKAREREGDGVAAGAAAAGAAAAACAKRARQ